jgi:hypothetical protein
MYCIRGRLAYGDFCFLGNCFACIHFAVLFNVVPEVEEKDCKMINFGGFALKFRFGKYQKVSLIYFPGLFFVTWIINELFTKSPAFGYTFIFLYLLIFAQSFVFIVPTTLLFLGLKKGRYEFVEDPKKTKRMMVVLFLLLLLIVVPLATVSHLNKIKLDGKIEEIRAQGVRVSHAAYYFSGKTTPIKFENLTEVLEIAKADGLTLYISNGSPDYHFLTVFGKIQIWFYPPEGRVSMIQTF